MPGLILRGVATLQLSETQDVGVDHPVDPERAVRSPLTRGPHEGLGEMMVGGLGGVTDQTIVEPRTRNRRVLDQQVVVGALAGEGGHTSCQGNRKHKRSRTSELHDVHTSSC